MRTYFIHLLFKFEAGNKKTSLSYGKQLKIDFSPFAIQVKGEVECWNEIPAICKQRMEKGRFSSQLCALNKIAQPRLHEIQTNPFSTKKAA